MFNNEEFNNTIIDIRKKYLMPDGDDYDGAMSGLFKLQDLYFFKPADIASGIKENSKFKSRPLTGYFYYILTYLNRINII